MTDFMAPVQQPVFDFGQLIAESETPETPTEVLLPEPLFGNGNARQDAGTAALERMVSGMDDGTVRQAPDHVSTVQRLAPALTDPAQLARAAAGVQVYADQLADLPPESRLPAAQVDLEKVAKAVESGKIQSDLWSKFTSAPERLTDDEIVELNLFVKQVGDATQAIASPDLDFDGGRVVKLVQNGADVVPYVELDDPSRALKVVTPGMPAVPAQADPGMYVMPDGRVAAFGTEAEAVRYRTLYPAAKRGDTIQWNVGRPRTVLDVELLRDTLSNQVSGHQTALWSNSAWPEGHPAMRADHVVVLNVPDGPIDKKLAEYGQVQDPKVPALVDGVAPPDPDDVPDYFEADEDELAPDRQARRQRQVALVIADPAEVAKTAKRLQTYGYDVDAVYTNQPPAEGFSQVREHVYTDVANTMVVRSRDPETGAYNGFSAWVPTDKAEALPVSMPSAHRRREGVQLGELAPGAYTVDGHAVLMLPPNVEPDVNPTKITLNGKRPAFVGMRFTGGVPEVSPVWGEAEPQGFDVVGVVSDNQIVLNVEPNSDLEPAIKFADTLGDMGLNPKRVRIVHDGETIRPA